MFLERQVVMKAVRIHSYGDTDQLKTEDIPKPEPKKNEVLVKIHDAGVNPIDWKIRSGYMKNWMPVTFPLTLGQDFAGEILEVGPEVTVFKKGDRVFGFAGGSYAELAAIPADKLAPIPEPLSYQTAASLPTAGLTAYQIILDKADVSAGKLFLIHGAAGGVGSFAVQLACWKKARVIATAAKSDEPYLRELGVERVIDYKTQRFEEFVKDVDAVVDLVGGNTLDRSYQIAKPGGLVITTVGDLDKKQIEKFSLKGIQFMMKQNPSELAALARLVAQGIVKPRMSRVLPLKDARKAQELNEKGQSHGKVVLHVS